MTGIQEHIEQIRMLEQNLQQLHIQKRSLEQERIELESALEEIDPEKDAWRMVGNLMVKSDAKKIQTDLSERKNRLQTRIEAFEKQEGILREKTTQLQQHIMEHARNGQD